MLVGPPHYVVAGLVVTALLLQALGFILRRRARQLVVFATFDAETGALIEPAGARRLVREGLRAERHGMQLRSEIVEFDPRTAASSVARLRERCAPHAILVRVPGRPQVTVWTTVSVVEGDVPT